MYAGGQSRANGGRGNGGRDALLRRRRQPSPPGAAAAAAAASSSSSGKAEEAAEEEEGGGGGKKLWRRKRQGKKREAVARAVRDGLPAAASSCWRGVSVVEETGGSRSGRSRRRDGFGTGSDRGGGDNSSSEVGSAAQPSAAAAAWCCVCPAGYDCSLEPNPSANGKEDPGVRSLLERNDFFSADCNPHAADSSSSPGSKPAGAPSVSVPRSIHHY